MTAVRRVLLVHNFYRSGPPSGENRSVREEIEGLERRGIQVELFARHSDDVAQRSTLGQAAHVLDPLGSPAVRRSYRKILQRFRPDVVHLENLWPFISPVVVQLTRERSIPIVASVRNYRLTCIAGTHFRAGGPCEDCNSDWTSAIRNSCYQSSMLRSVPMAIGRRRYSARMSSLDVYLPNSVHMRDYLLRTGIPAERILVRENAVSDPGPQPPPEGHDEFLFLGRLEEEKGVADLVDAWRSGEVGSWRLKIAGDGDLRELVRNAAATDTSISFVGHVDPSDVADLIRNTSVVVVPSRWPEPFGRVAIEAFAHSRPVVAYDSGALSSIVDDRCGWLIEPGVPALRRTLAEIAVGDPREIADRSLSARARYVDRYRPEVNLDRLVEGYELAVGTTRSSPAHAVLPEQVQPTNGGASGSGTGTRPPNR